MKRKILGHTEVIIRKPPITDARLVMIYDMCNQLFRNDEFYKEEKDDNIRAD